MRNIKRILDGIVLAQEGIQSDLALVKGMLDENEPEDTRFEKYKHIQPDFASDIRSVKDIGEQLFENDKYAGSMYPSKETKPKLATVSEDGVVFNATDRITSIQPSATEKNVGSGIVWINRTNGLPVLFMLDTSRFAPGLVGIKSLPVANVKIMHVGERSDKPTELKSKSIDLIYSHDTFFEVD